jgi:hypothetical protein
MLTARHPVDFPDTRAELEATSRYARAHDVEKGGRYDARAACILLWSHHWLHPATREESEIIASFYVRWGDAPAPWDIETDAGLSHDDLMAELGRLELHALSSVKQAMCRMTSGRLSRRASTMPRSSLLTHRDAPGRGVGVTSAPCPLR